MNKFLLFAVMSISLSAFAQDLESGTPDAASTPAITSSVETKEEHVHDPSKSHWLTTINFETSKYETPFEFSGQEKNFKPGDQTITGGRIGFGGEIYLGKGFATTSKVEGFYMGSLFTKAKNAAPEDQNIEFAYYTKNSTVWGVEAAQSLSYIFQMKTRNPVMGEWTYLTVEPFIEAGLGKGFANHNLKYKYELSSVQEYYRAHASDNFLNARIGAGVNFTSRQGYFLFLKATQNRYDVTDRKITGARQQNGSPAETLISEKPNNVKMDPVTVFALGGGYKF
jgi:hypothetical protein